MHRYLALLFFPMLVHCASRAESNSLTVSVAPHGGEVVEGKVIGVRVKSTPPGIDCAITSSSAGLKADGACSATWDYTSFVLAGPQLAATPLDDGSKFDAWTDDHALYDRDPAIAMALDPGREYDYFVDFSARR